MARSQTIGNAGEVLAEEALLTKGYEILCRNYRVRGGEIDIVARQQGVLVFAEVKTRSSNRFGEAREAVDARKQERMIRAAQRYLYEHAATEDFCRFDVLEVDASGFPADIRHWENAFDAQFGSIG